MISDKPIALVGGTGSPYTQKMLALLRYRRLPYAITWGQPAEVCQILGIEPPKPALMPTFLFEGEGGITPVCDSTPVIRQLEPLMPQRAVIPSDPALAFLDYLIEDFADEWCTKYMFHYRWHPPEDADNAGTLLPLGFGVTLDDAAHQQLKDWVTQRQVSRLYVVGSSDATADLIDASYRRFLAAMERHLSQQRFMLGNRPSACDFALFGQLSQLVGFDPTPRAIAHVLSPRAVAWVDQVADLSGLAPQENDWLSTQDQAASLRDVLAEIGRVYAPAQLANAEAVASSAQSWQIEMDGVLWQQQTFSYQAKCLRWTREMYDQLSEIARAQVDQLISGTGIEAMLAETIQ